MHPSIDIRRRYVSVTRESFFPEVKSLVDLKLGGESTPSLGYYGPNVYLQNKLIERLQSSGYWYQGGIDKIVLEIEIIDFKFKNTLGAFDISLTTRSTIKSFGASSTEVFTSTTKVGLGDALMGSRRNEIGMVRVATDQISKIDAQLLGFSAILERDARRNLETHEKRAKEDAEAHSLEQQRLADERERIEREGDGSKDDLACKARKLTPSTDQYHTCRRSLAAKREALEERARSLEEKRYQEKVEREMQTRVAADRAREREEQAQRRREREASKDTFYYFKEKCRDLGFKDKTEKLGACVLELSKRGDGEHSSSEPVSARGDGSADDQSCRGYGYNVGSPSYSDCRYKLDEARRAYEKELRAYESEKAAYERRAAEGREAARRRQQEKQAQYGFCVAACGSQPGSTALGCMSRCGAAAAGLPFDPGAAPQQPSGVSTYIINGRFIRCVNLESVTRCN